jgi:Mrp family chromosome partitioning ATPase
MSRVYSALTGATRPAGTAVLDAPDDGVWENSEEPAAATVETTDDAPFIEIGGPTGPIFSASLGTPPAPRALGETEPALRPQPKVDEPTRTYPRLVPPPAAYLSVRFHDVAQRAGAAGSVAGPDSSLVVFHLPDHAVSGEYRALRDEIRKQLPETPSRVLMWTAAAAEAGTTTVLLNLAIALASEEKGRVLVLDANLKRPAIAAKLGLKPGPGVSEVLTNRVPLTLAMQPTAVERLDALTAGDATDASTTAMGREFPRMLAQLRHWYDFVLVDGGTWGVMPERDATCSSADAVYLVTRDTHVDRPEFAAARGWVKELGGLLRGYVTTRV